MARLHRSETQSKIQSVARYSRWKRLRRAVRITTPILAAFFFASLTPAAHAQFATPAARGTGPGAILAGSMKYPPGPFVYEFYVIPGFFPGTNIMVGGWVTSRRNPIQPPPMSRFDSRSPGFANRSY